METWKSALSTKPFRRELILSTGLLAAVLTGFFFVLGYAEQRHGFVIEKNWLDGICAPRDLSVYIFSLTYSVTIICLIICFTKPATALLLIRTYLLLQLLRAIVLLLVPLDAPEKIIPLDDPFLHHTFYNGRPNLKDLFFSGHVATVLMFIPIVKNKFLRWGIALAAILLSILIVIQRVHYVADVAAAPFFVVIAFLVAEKWTKKSLTKITSQDGNP